MSVEELTTPKPRKSLDEIAALMAENYVKNRNPEEAATDKTDDAGEVEATHVDADDDGQPEQEPVVDEAANEEATVEDGPESGVEEEPAQEPQQENEEAEDFVLSDDDLIALDDTDDAEAVPLRDLKAAYKADPTIVAKVKEQEAATSNALRIQAQAQETSQKLRASTEYVMRVMGDTFTQPLYGPPDDTLKQTDPAQYIQRMDLYNQDQVRIAKTKEALIGALQQHAQQEEETLNTRRAQELELLHKAVPALRSPDEKIKASASKDILDAAEHYGFTAEDVKMGVDHRMFKMAYDAQQYRKLLNKTTATTQEGTPEEQLKVKQTRTLRSKSSTAKTRATAKARRIKTLKAKAAKSGKADDIATYMAAKRS